MTRIQEIVRAGKVGVLALALALSASYAGAAWNEAPSAPPSNNADAPLNVSSSGQIKIGGLTLNTGGAASGLIVQKGKSVFGQSTDGVAEAEKVVAYGNVWADKYCDRNGTNCKSTTEMGGGAPTPGGIKWVKMYQLNPEPTIPIAPGTKNLIINPSGYVECALPPDRGSGAELEFKADGVTYARLRADASNNNGGRVLLRAGTSGFVDVEGKTSIRLTVTKNTYNSGGTLHQSGPFSSAVACPSNSNMKAEVNSYSVFGIEGETEAVDAPSVDLVANPTNPLCNFFNPTCRSTLTWTTSRATSCTASGDWSGSKNADGGLEGVSFGYQESPNTYTLTCTGPGGSGSDSATVTRQ